MSVTSWETTANTSDTPFAQSFTEIISAPSILKALDKKGYTQPTPIQAQAMAPVAAGRDLLGIAQTGTGKTAAFALPLLQHLSENPRVQGRPLPRVLVLLPTRELAVQVAESFKTYGQGLGLRVLQVFGGVGEMPQRRALKEGVDILVATPGRLLDHLGQGVFSLAGVEALVLDEADRMMDMGFLPDVKRIVSKTPADRQTLLFSATMPEAIASLAKGWLREPVRIEVAAVSSTPERIAQSVYYIEKTMKPVLLRSVLENGGAHKVLVFTRTKHGADRLCKQLARYNIGALAIHGNKSQNARQAALEGFKGGQTRVLVATDIAARGIDVKGVDLVVNYDLPNEPETYVHRIGRTARAGAEGVAVGFCAQDERPYLRDIERLTNTPIERLALPLDLADLAAQTPITAEPPERRGPAQGRSGGNSRNGNSGRGGVSGNQRGGQPSGGQHRGGPRSEGRSQRSPNDRNFNRFDSQPIEAQSESDNAPGGSVVASRTPVDTGERSRKPRSVRNRRSGRGGQTSDKPAHREPGTIASRRVDGGEPDGNSGSFFKRLWSKAWGQREEALKENERAPRQDTRRKTTREPRPESQGQDRNPSRSARGGAPQRSNGNRNENGRPNQGRPARSPASESSRGDQSRNDRSRNEKPQSDRTRSQTGGKRPDSRTADSAKRPSFRGKSESGTSSPSQAAAPSSAHGRKPRQGRSTTDSKTLYSNKD